MLQMHCPNCKEVIKSPFLAEVSSLECSQCKEIVEVKDVYIATKNFTMHREDFLNRIFRFEKLLREVEKEKLLLANSKSVSAKSVESINQFYSSLQELLVGARNCYRLEVPCDLRVELDDNNYILEGRVLNLSTEGALIGFRTTDNLPRKKSVLKIKFSLPGSSQKLSAQAKVVWHKGQSEDQKSQPAIGVTFIGLNDDSHESIWNYILKNAPLPAHKVSK
jgi:hypothetical protein